MWWGTDYGRPAIRNVLLDPSVDSRLGDGVWHYNPGLTDLFYLPQSLASSFVTHGRLMSKYNVFLEIAVPTIYEKIFVNFQRLNIYSPWDGRPRSPWAYRQQFNEAVQDAIHPLKLYESESLALVEHWLANYNSCGRYKGCQ